MSDTFSLAEAFASSDPEAALLAFRDTFTV